MIPSSELVSIDKYFSICSVTKINTIFYEIARQVLFFQLDCDPTKFAVSVNFHLLSGKVRLYECDVNVSLFLLLNAKLLKNGTVYVVYLLYKQ